MEALIYFAIWGAAIFVMMRFGCGAHVMGHDGHRQPGSTGDGRQKSDGMVWTPPDKDIDPVCGKQVDTSRAKSSVHDGHVYYLCSRECREVFEAAPEQHLGPEAQYLKSSGMEKHHA